MVPSPTLSQQNHILSHHCPCHARDSELLLPVLETQESEAEPALPGTFLGLGLGSSHGYQHLAC